MSLWETFELLRMQLEMACVWVALWPRCRISKLRCVPSRKTVELLRMQRVYGSHCGLVLASASCAVSLSGGRLSRCGCSLCTGGTAAEFSHQRVALCVFVEGVFGLLWMRFVYGYMQPSFRISKLCCVSFWKTVDSLRMQRMYGCTAAVFCTSKLRGVPFGRRLSCCGCSVCRMTLEQL